MSPPRRRNRSLAANLTTRLAWIAVVVTLANVVFVAIYYGSDREGLEAEVVRREMSRLEAALRAAPRDGPAIGPEAIERFEAHPHAYGYALLNAAGEILESRNAELIPAAALDTGMFADDWISRRLGPHGRQLIASHVVALEPEEQRLVFVMNADPAGLLRGAILHEFVNHIWLPLIPIALLLIGANAVMIRRGLAPLGEAAAWARSVRPGRSPPAFPTERLPAEIADLTDATMRLHARLDTALHAEKRRAAEAAHALRTPLAALVARLDALPPGETTDRLRADLSGLARMVHQLLASAGADSLEAGDAVAVDLARVAESVVAQFAPVAIARGGQLALEIDPAARPACGDAGKIELALANLVENAVVHGGGGGLVRVGPGPCLAVADDGPGLPAGAAAAMYRPFWRGADAEPGGAGLGLAIVDRIQRAHGGRVEAEPETDGGAVFRLVYPAA